MSGKTSEKDKQPQPNQTERSSHHHGKLKTSRHVETLLNIFPNESIESSQFARPTSSFSSNPHQIVTSTTRSKDGDSSKSRINPMPEFPRIPTKQATLPLELQAMSTKDVYPNQETSQTLEEKQEEMKKSKLEQKNAAETEKKIIWNQNAPVNPFAHAHQYTKEPGAWYGHLFRYYYVTMTLKLRNLLITCRS